MFHCYSLGCFCVITCSQCLSLVFLSVFPGVPKFLNECLCIIPGGPLPITEMVMHLPWCHTVVSWGGFVSFLGPYTDQWDGSTSSHSLLLLTGCPCIVPGFSLPLICVAPSLIRYFTVTQRGVSALFQVHYCHSLGGSTLFLISHCHL